MTLTVRDLVTRAFRRATILASTETPSATEANGALVSLSYLLDRWQTERLTIAAQTRAVCALVNAQQRYTLGPGGNWDQVRPLWIDRATRLTAEGWETPVTLFTRTQWAQVAQKNLASTLPSGLFVNETYPLADVDVWPVPSDATVQIVLYMPGATLTSATSLDTSLSLAPGWTTALETGLAMDLSVDYGVPVPQGLGELAIQAKADLKRTNQLPDEAVIDGFLTSRRRWAPTLNDFNSGNI